VEKEEGDLKNPLVRKMVVLDVDEALRDLLQEEEATAVAVEEQTDPIDLKEILEEKENPQADLEEDVEKISLK
jgi:hypothetical protein